jgi:DNA (cytosine-5)-methyltransferase 1
VDERSITEVQAHDLDGYTQCHFFAGIGGWSAALRLAGWDDDRPVWTGSCPCQPFSEGGKKLGFNDPRDLWPVWFGLISECRPAIVFGEQVASADGVIWSGRTAQEMEAADYAYGTAILPATGVGGPHRRDRFYFVSHAIGADPGGRLADRRRSAVERTLWRPWTSEDWNGGQGRHERVVDGIPGRMAKAVAGGFGNAIVPELGAEFIVASSQALADCI